MKRKVIIIGQGFTGRLSIARSVGQIGCEVTIIALVAHKRDKKSLNTRRPVDSYSKYVKQVYYCYKKDKETLFKILVNQCRDERQKPIIIPDNDFSAILIDQHLDELKEFFLLPHIHHEQGAVGKWMEKIKQKELARQMGMNVANAHIVEIRNRDYYLCSGIDFPCFVKPAVSAIGGKSGLKLCHNEQELLNHLDYLRRFENIDVLVEEFMDIEQEFAVLGFSDGKEVIIPGKLEILKLAHANHFGVAIQGRISPVGDHEKLIETFKKYILSIGFVGIFDIDYYKTRNQLYFGELNLRFGGSGYAYTKLGVNLPAMFVKYISGENYDHMPKRIESNAIYLNERMLIDEWLNGFISKKERQQLEKSSDISFVADEEDKGPYLKYKKVLFLEQIKHYLKNCLKKKR